MKNHRTGVAGAAAMLGMLLLLSGCTQEPAPPAPTASPTPVETRVGPKPATGQITDWIQAAGCEVYNDVQPLSPNVIVATGVCEQPSSQKFEQQLAQAGFTNGTGGKFQRIATDDGQQWQQTVLVEYPQMGNTYVINLRMITTQ